jgi:hypothetical protein
MELRGHSLAIEKLPIGEGVWQITFIDRASGDVVFAQFNEEVKDHLLAQMQGGIVVASEVPKNGERQH